MSSHGKALAKAIMAKQSKRPIAQMMGEAGDEPKHSADAGEYDYEGDMAKSQLKSIITNAQRLHDMLEDNTNLPEWVQSKITLAEDYVLTAANYMEGEMNEEVEQIDELKKSTLKSYVKKASTEAKKAYDYHQMRYGGREGSNPEYMKKTYPAMVAKFDRREAGVEKAKQKLAKEEVEQVDHAKIIAKSLAATHPNFRVSSYDGDHGRAHVVHHKSDSRNFRNGEELMGPNIQLQHNHKTNKVHMEMQGAYHFDDRDEETHNPDNAHEAAHKMFKPAIDLIHTTDKTKTNEEVEQVDEASHVAYLKPKAGAPSDVKDHFDLPVHSDSKQDAHDKFAKVFGKSMAKHYEVVHVKPKAMEEEVEQVDEKAPPGAKYERMVKHIKKGYAKGGLTDKEKSIAYATAWKAYKKNEETETEGEQIEEKYMGFKAVMAAAKKGGARNPAAVAAAIGRKKYGKEKFQAMAAAGKKAANEEVDTGEYDARKKAPSDDKEKVFAKHRERMEKLKQVTEAEGTVAVTPKEKALAAHHGDPNRITYGDVIKARLKSAAAKKMGK